MDPDPGSTILMTAECQIAEKKTACWRRPPTDKQRILIPVRFIGSIVLDQFAAHPSHEVGSGPNDSYDKILSLLSLNIVERNKEVILCLLHLKKLFCEYLFTYISFLASAVGRLLFCDITYLISLWTSLSLNSSRLSYLEYSSK